MNFEIKSESNFDYVDVGKGPVLLLLHGLFGALSNWKQVIEAYKEKYRVIIPLLPIYQMPLPKTSVGGLSDFVHDFVKLKNLKDFHVLGNSLGGHVALVYTLEHGEYVKSIVLTGSSGLYENSMGGSFPKRNNYDFIRERVEYTFFDPDVASKELVDEVFHIVNTRSKALRIVHMAKSAIRHNLRKEIPQIKIPACLIWGKNDKITPPEVAEEFHSLFTDSELHFIENCGHAPMMEKPEQFNNALAPFLEKAEALAKISD